MTHNDRIDSNSEENLLQGGPVSRYFSSQTSGFYGVSAKVIEVRLEREDLWIIS